MCAIAAQEHRILQAVGTDRGGEILRVPDALLFPTNGIPHRRKHKVDTVVEATGVELIRVLSTEVIDSRNCHNG
jgi:hypothetical protein